MEYKHFDTAAELETAVVHLLGEALYSKEASQRMVLLSGGNTPLPIYRRLAMQGEPVPDSVWAAFTDERHVPPESPLSNFGLARPMLEALALPESHIIRVLTEIDIEAAARRYEEAFYRFCETGGDLTLGLLGLGADGHTCSLFTQEDLDLARGRLAIPVKRNPEPHRVSVTPDLLNLVRRIVFIVAGPEKMSVAAQLLDNPDTLVAGRAVSGCPHVELWQAP
jgi:6-phosphogluconolactonase